ncbi:MAG: formyltransferase family protein [Bacteroidia bacterium]|nr:formyltransferase family protein [Bacteroidia bacterium]
MESKEIINYFVVPDKPGRKYTTENDTRWGGFFEPDPSENPGKTDDGLRVVLFASWDYGYLVLETLKEFEQKFPGQLNLVGLVTDDPVNPDAKISLKKRVWNLLELPYRVIDETFIIESGLNHGIPVYTGEVKVKSFQRIMEKWNPDAILVCVFGQIIDSFTINLPRYGIYNFHPSDLSLHQGAGPAPYDDLANRCEGTTVWSVHHITEEVDRGEVVGKSTPVNVLDSKGDLPGNPLVVYHKLAEVLSPLAYFLVKELSRNFELNRPGKIGRIDFDGLIPDKIKTSLMQPVTHDSWTDVLTVPEGFLFKPGQNEPVSQVGADR